MFDILQNYMTFLWLTSLDYLNQGRKYINDECIDLEPWQIMAYTISAMCLLFWTHRIFFGSDEKITFRIKRRTFTLIRRLPWIENKIQSQLETMKGEMERSMHKMDPRREFHKFLPDVGQDPDDILMEAEGYNRICEFDYNQGSVSGAVYTNYPEAYRDMITRIYEQYAIANPMHPEVFGGARKMEAEVVRMVCNMFHGGPNSCGTLTAGGTQSILQACFAYRNRAYERGISNPEMVVPITAHAAFDKAASMFKIRIRHVPVDPQTYEVDMWHMNKMINSNTCMLVGSAPNYPHGIIDPLEEISRLGYRYGIPVHVDACLGGFLIAFMDQCGFFVKAFDFRLSGVTSISCDTHKYGFTPKGSSVIMYRDESYIHYQYFSVPDWPGGVYATQNFEGSRNGSAIAATWATLLYYGKEGYVEAARSIIETAMTIKTELAEIDGIEVIGDPKMSVIAFTSHPFSIFDVAERMKELGWDLNTLQNPAAVHIAVTLNHTRVGITEKFVNDIKQVVMDLVKSPPATMTDTAKIYGTLQSIPDKTLVKEFTDVYLDSVYSTISSQRKYSIAERKLSISQRPLPPQLQQLAANATTIHE